MRKSQFTDQQIVAMTPIRAKMGSYDRSRRVSLATPPSVQIKIRADVNGDSLRRRSERSGDR